MKKIIIGIIIGGIIFTLGGVVATTAISSNQVTYQNKTVGSALDELYNSAVEGKEVIAAAITNKGISTTSNDTYDVMAANINSIDTDHSELNQKISSLESKHTSDIASLTGSISNINQILNNQNYIEKVIDVKFSGYWALVTNEQLGVENASQYVWNIVPAGYWAYFPFIYGYSNGLMLRCWQLNAVSGGQVNLYSEGTISISFKGIKIK